MARYRYGWKNDANGWYHRLDILPYDETLAGSVTAMGAGSVVEIGDMEMSFDELPVGLMDAPTMSVTLNWNRIPSALKTRLQNVTSGNDRNIFLFFTDRGTNEATYYLEFCGTQANEDSADYDLVNSDDVSIAEYVVKYDLVDCMHHILSSYGGSSVFDGSLYTPSDGRKFQGYYEYIKTPRKDSYYDIALNLQVKDYSVSSWSHIMARMRTALSNVLNGDYARTTNATELSDADGVDRTLEWDTLVTTGATFFQRVQDIAAPQTQLDEDTLYLVTHVYGFDGTLLGGLWDNSDEYGWYQVSALVDLMRDLCETLGVKASYYPEYVTDAGGDYIRYTWNVAAVGDSTDGLTSALAVDLERATDISTISEGAATIQKAEMRADLNSSRYNYDLSEHVAINQRSRSTRSWNFEPVIHNMPSYKPTVKGTQGLIESGLYQTNRISTITSGGDVLKAHEATTVNISNLSGITYTTTFIEPKPEFTESDSGDPLADSRTDNLAFTGWLNEAQRSSSPVAVAEAMLQAFGSQFQTTVEATYPLSYSNNVRPHRFGYVHNLSNGPQSEFTHLPWSRAAIVGMTVNWTEGTNTIAYVLMDLT